ncbi:RES family NAD+ phosphorylase [Orrella sp. JC864]|uniref:RES family NAD+ phosphorylase n=1 Tax=Orrella sp. JC864 TaxID=3120298 RepID=UPI00300B7FF9
MMMTLWRLSNGSSLAGGAHPGGRWVCAGANVVLLDATPLAAICARLALAEAEHPRRLPRGYQLLEVKVPRRGVLRRAAPGNWRSDIAVSREFGQNWFDSGASLLLEVPGLSGAPQYLLNCSHPDLARCKVISSSQAPFSPHTDALAGMFDEQRDWLAKPPVVDRA